MRHRQALALALLALMTTSLSSAQKTPTLLPGDPNSDARWAPIERFKREAPPLAEKFEARAYRDAAGETMPYRLFKPKTEPGRLYPLVLFLHGSSGSGTDNVKQLDRGSWFGSLVWVLTENQRRHPCFVLAPQSNENWPPVRLREGQLPEILLGPGRDRLAIEIVEKLLAEFPIDRQRIYVTGHSMGGAGTWHILAQRPDLFAAGVPVCGRAHPATLPELKDIPIWNFHGETDEIESVETSRVLIAELRKLGGKPLYTEYPGVGHNVFMWAYTEPALVEWVFEQRKKAGRLTSATGLRPVEHRYSDRPSLSADVPSGETGEMPDLAAVRLISIGRDCANSIPGHSHRGQDRDGLLRVPHRKAPANSIHGLGRNEPGVGVR